jgi:hypothetical protein
MHNQHISVTERVMDVVTHNPGCLLEEVVLACPDLSWNQVFLEVDRLSRNGQIRLRRQGMSLYRLSVPGYERTDA